ncbi:MAG: nuclear transport factor 2 family protein [Bacteroidetes bacterium]|nr:nuclear transport factor 2 family protein [Bacteroidota bacterium]
MKQTAICLFFVCSFISTKLIAQTNSDNDSLYKTIVKLDSTLFDAYNNCNMEVYASLFSEDLEFYHDKGGLSKSKTDMVESVKKYVCNKVRRELKPGSIEVSPVPGFGAIELGKHRFHNIAENSESPYANFVVVWKYSNNKWLITRVISLH